jgi:Bardet-Biedl syndrome 2 protein
MNVGGDVILRCDDMDIAADVIQDLCAYMQVDQLESNAYFPVAMNQFKEVLIKVDEYSVIRLKLTAEMADNSNLIKALVIKAEDARILGDM